MTKDNIVTYIKKAIDLSHYLDHDPQDMRPPKLVKDWDMLHQHLSMLIMVLEMETNS
jgi:hypothetical protein